ncbi:MAG: hypothetical protein IT303_08365 [Dehalococcoidia bacterium]|nr:hypothetical protein [Dehalococcoidia bacterium]
MTPRSAIIAAIAVLVLPLLAACSDRGGDSGEAAPGDTATEAATETSTARPGTTSTPAATGTTSTPAAGSPTATAAPAELPEGLQQVLDRVAEVRGLAAPPDLKVEFLPRSKLNETLEGLTTDEDRRWFAQTTVLYRLLGHMANDQDYETIFEEFTGDAVLGFYSPLDKALWVVYEDGDEFDPDDLSKEVEATLAHEFIHAIQDYHFDLVAADKEVSDSLDADLALTALIEGDAVTHEKQYRAKYLAAMPAGGGAVILARLPAAAQLPNVPPGIVRELYFPYDTGANWVASVRQSGGVDRINELFEDPPPATSYVLHPDLLDRGWTPEQVALPDLAPALGNGWVRDSGGAVGEFGLRNWLQLQVAASTAGRAGTGWAGDHYDVYVSGDDSVAAFRYRFATETDARELADALTDFLDRSRATTSREGEVTLSRLRDGDVVARAEVQGRDVVFTIATDAGLAQKALEALLRG